jgi:hypothetical protein
VALSFALARTSPHRRISPFHIAENRKLSKLQRSGKCDFCKNPCRADVLRDKVRQVLQAKAAAASQGG